MYHSASLSSDESCNMHDITNNLDQISRRELILRTGSLLATGLITTAPLFGAEDKLTTSVRKAPRSFPLHAFCGTGDHLWGRHIEPVDSPATIHAML